MAAGCDRTDPRAPAVWSRVPPGLQSRFDPPDGWTWALIAPAASVPAARYGVSAPPSAVVADVLILASYGEPAEVWFETARELNAKGCAVWVLEPVGQGGGGRYSRLRDLGYADSLTADVLATEVAAERVVHRRPLIVLASGTSAPAAIQAVAAGAPADGLILTSPRLSADPPAMLSTAGEMQQWRLGWLRADLHGGWSPYGLDDRAQALTHDRTRGRLRLAWQTANPALRMGTPSWSWISAFSAAVRADAASEPHVGQPVLVLEPAGARTSSADCRRMVRCTLQAFPGAGQALELEADAVRRPWVSAVEAFMAQAVSGSVGRRGDEG